MAATIRIKRSGTSGNPTTLAAGELAYSYLADNGSNGGDRLYIGTGVETGGDAANHEVIGGVYFTEMLDHTKGTLTANSAIIVGADSKIDRLLIDDITLDGSTISASNILTINGTNGVTFDTNGNDIDMGSVRVLGVATPTDSADATNKAYVDAQIGGNSSFTLSADEGSNDTFTAGSVLTFAGGTGLTSIVSNDQILYELDSTAVTPGSYGSTTQIPTFTVDAQGRLTAASTVNVATTLTVNGDPISILDSDLTFAASGNGFAVSYHTGTNTVTYTIDDATTSSKGVAQFLDSDFSVSSGEVSLANSVISHITTDSGSATGANHRFTLQGNSIQGTVVEATGSTITVDAKDATYSQKGVASFSSGDFEVSSGAVSLDSDFLRSITTDDGAITMGGHAINIIGGEGIDVNHSGTTITVNGEDATTSNKGVASFDTSDFTVTGGAVSLKTGSVENSDLANDDITIGDNAVALGATLTDVTGLTGATIDNIRIDGNTISTNTSTPNLILDPKGGDSAGGKVVIYGDLQVEGTTTTVNSTEVSINDLTLTLADSAADATAANGAGIVIDGANATFTYAVSGDKWTFNKDIDVTGASDLTGILLGGVTLRERLEDHLGNTFFAAGEGLDITYGAAQDSDNSIIFAAELATYTNKGVASFDSDQFTVTSGFTTVSQLDGGVY